MELAFFQSLPLFNKSVLRPAITSFTPPRASLPPPHRQTLTIPLKEPIGYPVTAYEEPSSSETPLLFLQNPTGFGTTQTYWDPFIEQLNNFPSTHPLRQRSYYTLDWIGSGDCDPKPRTSSPYLPSYYAEQLKHFVESNNIRPILVGVGTVEPVAIWLAYHYPQLVGGVILSNGLSKKFITRPKTWKQRLSWSLFSSPLGLIFWYSCTTRSFLRGFARKNLLTSEDDEILEAFVKRARAGSRDVVQARRVRYGAFTFLSGNHFDDYRNMMGKITVPFYYLVTPTKKKPSTSQILKALRPYLPIEASEGVLLEDRSERLVDRIGMLGTGGGELIDSGFELWFEDPSTAAKGLERGINWVEANQKRQMATS